MIAPEIIRNIQPLFVEGKNLVFARGNKVYTAGCDLKKVRYAGRYDAGFLQNIVTRFPLLARTARFGFHKVKPVGSAMVGIQKGAIVYKSEHSHKFESVCTGFRGSRPFDLLVTPGGQVYFGEYFGNPERGAVYIYGSPNGRDWKKVWTFEAGAVRHVHGLTWDPYRKGIWVQTGDTDEESGLWFTGDDFSTLRKVVGGSQKARAVEIIVDKEALIVPMDSPLEQNYIFGYNLKSDRFQKLCSIPGSAFRAAKVDDIYVVTTVTEPSEVNKVNYASVWASLDGRNWKCLARLQRDWFPVKYQPITRYSEIMIAEGENRSPYLVTYGRALKGADNSMIRWRKDRVREFLSV